jgi:hypothetical protein
MAPPTPGYNAFPIPEVVEEICHECEGNFHFLNQIKYESENRISKFETIHPLLMEIL